MEGSGRWKHRKCSGKLLVVFTQRTPVQQPEIELGEILSSFAAAEPEAKTLEREREKQ